jgi:AcrR family transcriptional regulator
MDRSTDDQSKPGARRGPSRRTDAERNRTRILDTARTALEQDSDASMQSIAKLAGIGQGTLYRNFPNREALVLAVHRRDVQDLIDAAPRLAAGNPPLAALRRWLDELGSYGRIKHGLAGALNSSTREQLATEGYDPVVDAMGTLLRACQQAGEVRADVTADDLLLLVGFLWRISPDENFETRSRHLLDLVMDALRCGDPPRSVDLTQATPTVHTE